jgi:hypothetical protein
VIAASVATAIPLIIPQAGEIPPLSEYVEVPFWSYEREDWRLSDQLEVDPSDPSPVGPVAKKLYEEGLFIIRQEYAESQSSTGVIARLLLMETTRYLIDSAHEEKLATDGRPIRE